MYYIPITCSLSRVTIGPCGRSRCDGRHRWLLLSLSLGVVLASNLSWQAHIDHVTKKFYRVMFALRFFRRYTTETLHKNLATALLFPHLDYCSLVFLDASQELKKRLQRLQNSCVRYVLGLGRGDHISPHRVTLGWLRIDSRRLFHGNIDV